jgi:type IV pilus assembly protein PilN
MIRINLLPVKEEKLINEAKGFLIIFVISLALIIVLVFLNSTVLSEREAESKMRIDEADKEIANLKSIMGEIQTLKAKKAKLQEKMDMIVRLQEQNIGPVRVLDELSLKLPSNKIWVEKLTLKGDKMSMDGKTLENQEVANFMKQLENSLFFSGINLKKVSKDKTVKGVPMLSYNLNTVVHFSGRQEKPATQPPANAPAAPAPAEQKPSN